MIQRSTLFLSGWFGLHITGSIRRPMATRFISQRQLRITAAKKKQPSRVRLLRSQYIDSLTFELQPIKLRVSSEVERPD